MYFPDITMINNDFNLMGLTSQVNLPAKGDELPTFNGVYEAATGNTFTTDSNSANADPLPTPQTTGTFNNLLKKRRPTSQIVKATDPEATIMDIISDKTLTTHIKSKKKIQKTEDDTTTLIPFTTDNAVTQFIFQNGQLVPVATVAPIANKIAQTTKTTTSSSFKTLNHTDKWTDADNKKFFEGIELFGCDFSMIALLFPARNRAQVKNKFLKEEKVNADAVKKALFNNVHKNTLGAKTDVLMKIMAGNVDIGLLLTAIQA
jgi:hypothetical protein